MPFAAKRSITGPKAARSAASPTWAKGQVRTAVGRAPPGPDLVPDGMRGEVAGGGVAPRVAAAIARQELLHLPVQQPPAQLVAKRVPHDRVHADEAGEEMADGEELHELHVDQCSTRGEREGMALVRHVGRGAGARVEPRQPAGRDHRHPCRQRDGAAGFHIEAHRACEPPRGPSPGRSRRGRRGA